MERRRKKAASFAAWTRVSVRFVPRFREIRRFLRIIPPSSHSLPPPPTRAVAGAGQLRGKKATARAGKSTRAASLLLDSAMQIAVQRDDYAQFWRASSPNLRVVPATDQQRWRVKEKKKEKKVSWQRKQKKRWYAWLWPPDCHVHGGCTPRRVEKRNADARKKSRECCKNPGPPIGRIVSSPTADTIPTGVRVTGAFSRELAGIVGFFKLHFHLTQRRELPGHTFFASFCFVSLLLVRLDEVSESRREIESKISENVPFDTLV